MIEGSQDKTSVSHAADQSAGRLSSVSRRRYFSSTEGPFQSANNVFLFYGGAGRSQLINDITDQVKTLDEPVYVCGESGSGKSMVSLVLSHTLQTDYKIIHFDHQHCDFDRLLRQLLIELTPDLTHVGSGDMVLTASTAKQSLKTATKNTAKHHASRSTKNNEPQAQSSHLVVGRLLSRLQTGKVTTRPILLLIDSVVIDDDANDLVRQLTSIHSTHGRLVSAVVFLAEQHSEAVGGAMDINNGRRAKDVRANSETSVDIGAAYPHHRLQRLSLSETTDYLNHHMLLFDFNKRDLFNREMAYFIADRSGGNCNVINALARNAFLLAHLEGAEHINMRHLLVAGLPDDQEKPLRFLQKYKRAASLISLFAVSSLALIAVIAFFLS